MKLIIRLLLASLCTSTLLLGMQKDEFNLQSKTVKEGSELYRTAETRLHQKQFTLKSVFAIGLTYFTYRLYKNYTEPQEKEVVSEQKLTNDLQATQSLSLLPSTALWKLFAWTGGLIGITWSKVGSELAGRLSGLISKPLTPVFNKVLPVEKPWAHTLSLQWFIDQYIPDFGTYKNTLNGYLSYSQAKGNEEYKQIAQQCKDALKEQGPAIARDIQHIVGALAVIAERIPEKTSRETVESCSLELLETLNKLYWKNYDNPQLVNALFEAVQTAVNLCDSIVTQK